MQNPEHGIPLRTPADAANALLSLQGRNASNSASIPSAANLPANIFTNPSIQPSSVINLSNSSEVVIGPMTQYQGPVTIYQYMDATVEARATQANTGFTKRRFLKRGAVPSVRKASPTDEDDKGRGQRIQKRENKKIIEMLMKQNDSESVSLDGVRQNNTTESKTVLQTVSKNSKLVIILILALIIGAGIAVYVIQNKSANDKDRAPREILFGNEYETGTIPNLGNGHLVIDRTQWGASERSTEGYPLEHPIPYVLITHIGVQSTPCYNVYKCSIKMRTIQDSAIAEKNLRDINSNFYVGNDGYVYVGRGWDLVNTYANKTLAVTFLGDYIRSDPDPKQLEAVQFLLAFGVTQKYIALDYKLVAQNQTRTTRSPGAYVYKEIIKWPHWYPCGMNKNPRCGSEIGLPDVWDAKQ